MRTSMLKGFLFANLSSLPSDSCLNTQEAIIPIVKTIPSDISTGAIAADFTSTKYALDGPKLSAVNSTAFDWWYFDAVASDLSAELVVSFFTSLPSAFTFLEPEQTVVTTVGIFTSFANGTQNIIYLDAEEAIIETVGDGSSGNFVGAGASWVGSPDMETYTVTVNSTTHNIFGTFDLKSRAPAHYPCGPREADQSMIVGQNFGWSNAMPDADAIVDFKIQGTETKFEGMGYHDKNWGPQPFADNVLVWYWGHGRLGPYSIVWFDFLGTDGKNYVSAYASQNGRIITTSCSEGSVKVRPRGANSEYLPFVKTGPPSGFIVEMQLDDANTLVVNVTTKKLLTDAFGAYYRWSGSMEGRINGGPSIDGGVAILEQFVLRAKLSTKLKYFSIGLYYSVSGFLQRKLEGLFSL